MSNTTVLRATAAAVAALASSHGNGATINLIDLGGVAGSPAEQGFKIAADYWGKLLTNTATINLGVRFAALGPGIIGSSSSRKVDLPVVTWESGVNATKSTSAIDSAIVLPGLTGGGISGLTVGVDASGNNDTSVTAMLNGTQTASPSTRSATRWASSPASTSSTTTATPMAPAAARSATT